MNLLAIPNVTVASDKTIHEYYEKTKQYMSLATLEEAKAKTWVVGENSVLTELVRLAVVKWPQWKFKMASVYHFHRAEPERCEIQFAKVDVYSEQGIHIGQIGSSKRYKQYGGDEYVVWLFNARINKARERSNRYTTKDAKAALREMKKSFYAPTITEVVEDANENAHRLLCDTKAKWTRAAESSVRKLMPSALLYLSGTEQRRERFGAWYQKTNRGAPELAMSMLKEYRSEYKHVHTISDVQEALRDDKTALVIKNQDGYILRIDKEVKLCDDSTLPEKIKAKLGMLKLVEAGQVISNVGARVNDETFLVVLDDEAQA